MKIKKEDFNLVERLIDFKTQQTVGYILCNRVNRCALSLKKIIDLNLPVATYMQFAEIPSRMVLFHNNRYGLRDNSVMYLKDYEDTPYEKLEDKEVIYGYVFEPQYLIELDNEVALNNTLVDSEGDR